MCTWITQSTGTNHTLPFTFPPEVTRHIRHLTLSGNLLVSFLFFVSEAIPNLWPSHDFFSFLHIPTNCHYFLCLTRSIPNCPVCSSRIASLQPSPSSPSSMPFALYSYCTYHSPPLPPFLRPKEAIRHKTDLIGQDQVTLTGKVVAFLQSFHFTISTPIAIRPSIPSNRTLRLSLKHGKVSMQISHNSRSSASFLSTFSRLHFSFVDFQLLLHPIYE